VLQPIQDFTKSFVDDMIVHSNDWKIHAAPINRYLTIMKSRGFSLGLKKCDLGKPEVKLVGHIVGCGHNRSNPEKITAIPNLKELETKKQVRQINGLFSFFCEYMTGFTSSIKPLTALTKAIWRTYSIRFNGTRSFTVVEKHAVCSS